MEVLTMAERLTFAEKLASATNEDKQVNPIYVNAISANLPKLGGGMDAYNPSYNLYTDGVFDCYYLKDNGDKEWFLLQLECKLDVDLSISTEFAKVLIQVLYYIKQFERANWSIPKVVVLGTKKNCMVLPTEHLYTNYIKNQGYATEDEHGRKISASTAPNHHLYQPLLNRIASDVSLQTKTRIIGVEDKNSVKELCIDILKVAKDLGIKEEVTAENLARAFDFFDMKVLTEKSRKNLSSRVKAEAFMQLMLNPEKVQTDFTMDVLGNKIYSGTMNFNGTLIEVDNAKFNSFANVFAVRQYSVPDQKKITEITDRLIEDTDRRRKGDFYTPTIWVNEAHKLMDKNLGADWRQKCIVWDCAWGTGNLTRDYKFSDLYCSTLMEEDLKIGAKYNPFATKFQYDFLNDDVEEFESLEYLMWEPFRGTAFYRAESVKQYINLKDIAELYATAAANGVITEEQAKIGYGNIINRLHQTKLYSLAPKLIDSLLDSDKPLVFLINPPYGTAGEFTSANGKEKKTGVAESAINQLMKLDSVGGCSQQLYAQFVYRIKKIQETFGVKVKLGLFSPTLIMTGTQFKGLRKYTGDFLDGYMIQASEFADVKANWAISFTIWDTTELQNTSQFKLKAFVSDEQNCEYHPFEKELYIPQQKASDWAKEIKPKGDMISTFTMSNAINITDGTCKISEHSLGVALMNQNIVESNQQFVMILPRKLKGHLSAFDITPETFSRIISLFSARKLIVSNWINCKDEYMVPNVNHPSYKQWEADCIVYSLFHSASNQSSLRDIDYNGQSWNIYNEFFWLSRETMLGLAGGENNPENTNNAVYNDCLAHAKSERFVYEKLQTVSMSEDAKFVLDYATAILIETFKHREEFNRNHPEYHINTWDAGWYQIKALAKEYIPEQLKAFNEIYKKFEDRMRPLVYELGFLYE